MSAVAETMGLHIEFVPDTWKNTLEALKDSKIDAVTGMMYSWERDRIFDFSIPNLIVPYALFKRKETPIRSLPDVMNKDYEIIIVDHVFAYEWLKENTILNPIIAVSSPTEALQLLASGKHDCVIMPRLHGLNLLDDLKIDNVETIGPPVLGQKFSFAVTQGNSDLLAELNEGIFLLQQSGEYDEIYLKWFSVDKHSKNDKQFLSYALFFLAAVVLLLLAILFWNWFLKRAVRLKTIEIRRSEAKLKQIIDGIPIATFVIDENRRVTHWNRACELLSGEKAEKIIGTKDYCKALCDEESYSIVDLLMDNVLTGRVQRYDSSVYRKSALLEGAYETQIYRGSLGLSGRWLYGSAIVLRDETGKMLGGIETWQDFTELKQLERQLIQSQKMEAVGTLAGGIAHDFNNIITAVIGHAELALTKLSQESGLRINLEQILAAGKRANNLLKQLLTFSYRAKVEPEPVQVSALVKEALTLIGASLPANIAIEQDIQTDALVSADETHIHQVVMNLCANASHAMSKSGGVIGVQLSAVSIGESEAGHETGLKPGDFVMITVSDTGEGIPLEIQNQVLDPFFTTKSRGEGTGMGLSVTHGIVKKYGGMLTFNSQPGKGSIFEVYLPVLEGDIPPKIIKD